MATKKTLAKNWQENYASFILGAIIVVILGLLVANFITQRNQRLNDEASTEEAMQEEQKAAEDAAKPGEYKVVSDDSLSKIADKTYGDMSLWPVIARANNITNPNVIHVDSILTLPSKAEVEQMKADMTATEYTVKQGDTLFMIAQRVYGNGWRWTELSRANKVGRLPNGNPLIFVDQKLTIPR